jgi:nucleotide-binding universal stress UspA family protein
MKTIIVPIDFSEESLNGLKLAIMLSHKISVDVQMVYVLHISKGSRGANPDDEIKYANRKFEKLITDFEQELGSASKLRYIVKKGNISKEIVNQAHSYRDALIIASTHGATGFKEAFIGSNAFKILHSTNLPVFTVRSDCEPSSTFSKILLPITNTRSTRQKVPISAELAKIFGAEVHLLKLGNKRNQKGFARVRAYTQQIAAYLAAAKVEYKIADAPSDNYSESVIQYAKQIGADLISISAQPTSKLGILFGNYSHQILAKADIPVLSVTPRLLGRAGSFSTFGG